MACIAYSCSTSFLTPNAKRCAGTQADSNKRRSKLIYSVMSWFEKEKELSDVMPDTGTYLFSYPKKITVFERYQLDVHEVTRCSTCELGRLNHPGPCGCPNAVPVYLPVSEQYFFACWKKHFVNCQIRKHTRFSKCTFCLKWRILRNKHSTIDSDRQAAREENVSMSITIGSNVSALKKFISWVFVHLFCDTYRQVSQALTCITLAQQGHLGSRDLHHHRHGWK